MKKTSTTNIILIVVLVLAAAGFIYYFFIRKKDTEEQKIKTGNDVLSKSDADSGESDGMIDLIKFLNLPAVRDAYIDSSNQLKTQVMPDLFSEQLAKLAVNAADTDAKKAIIFNADVEARLNRALGINTINTISAKDIYAWSSNTQNSTVPGQPPSLLEIRARWQGEPLKYKDYA